MNLDTAPSHAITRWYDGENDEEYCRVDYEFGVYFGPAEIEFRLMYGGEIRGSVRVEYP
jgi:hypothetical protein